VDLDDLKGDRLFLIVAGDLLYKKVAPGDCAKPNINSRAPTI
jgi:hypothetical protein